LLALLICKFFFNVFQNYYGKISLLKDTNSAVNDVKNGYPLQYRVDFPLQSPLPKPTAIILNDRQLCSGPQGEVFIESSALVSSLF
jgi:hypothetical protein